MCGIDKGVAWSNATLRYLSCGHTGKVHSGFQVVTRSAHGKNRMVTGKARYCTSVDKRQNLDLLLT